MTIYGKKVQKRQGDQNYFLSLNFGGHCDK